MPLLEQLRMQERDALIRETRLAGVLPLVALNAMDTAARVPSIVRARYPVSLRGLAGARGAAFVQDCRGLNYKSLWVSTQNVYYREDYLVFLNSEFGLKLTAIPDTFHIDHLYNRARAAQYGLQFIRTALIPRGVNTSHGAGYERTITAGEARRVRRDIKLMDEITCMKFLGFASPHKGQIGDLKVEQYVKFAAQAFGLPEAAIRRNIEELMEKAGSGWAAR